MLKTIGLSPVYGLGRKGQVKRKIYGRMSGDSKCSHSPHFTPKELSLNFWSLQSNSKAPFLSLSATLAVNCPFWALQHHLLLPLADNYRNAQSLSKPNL